MPIELNTPMTSTTDYITVTNISIVFGSNGDSDCVTLTYAPADAQGNVTSRTLSKSVGLTDDDLTVFFSTVGSLRIRAQAALQSNQAALAGTST